MYLKVESVSAVEITSTTSRLSGAVNPLSPASGQRQGVTKIPVPLQHRQGGGAAAAAAVAAAASAATGASACTPDEIYCYTQSNSNINRTTSLPFNHHHLHQQEHYQYHHHYNQAAAATATTAALNRGFSRLPPPAAQHHYNPASAIANSSANMGIHHIDATAFASTVDVQHGPGRPDRLEQVMGLHPQYMKIFNKSQSFIMRGDGPLPYPYRHYIAIMAAGRHQCSYLIQQQVSEFLQQGGDKRWLNGLHAIPAKLRDLYDINKILAHRPWLITKHHIEKLTKGSDSWSLGELVHALVILSHYHAISSFVFGVGIGDGEDEPPCCSPSVGVVGHKTSAGSPAAATPTGNSSSGQSTPNSASGSPPTNRNGGGSPLVLNAAHREIETASARIVVAGSNQGSKSNSGCGSPNEPRSAAGSRRGTNDFGMMQDHEVMAGGLDGLMKRMKNLAEHRQEYSAEEQTKRYEHVESQSAELGVVGSSAAADGFSSSRPKPEISQFIDDPDFTYQDFARRGSVNQIPTFRIQDYSWDDHAFSLVNRLYNDVGNLLDDKFRLMYQLTYNFMGSKRDVDTSRFRTAIWNYIQCMFGIRHDDYDYGEVNQVLERSLKAYIKAVVCFPERVTRDDYNGVLKELHHSEKIHVNLMLLEARIQAELLYSLRAVMRYMI
ncbi:Sestrin-like protein [Daphnia sinensis]|uniref:Sestrin-like protein n=1 Tax=Daphnia sinensis TaxID=1820382 RepID=A0AAD5PXR6_9CRUS|nr:Sestrin-like protein [Daphnia sinensis]